MRETEVKNVLIDELFYDLVTQKFYRRVPDDADGLVRGVSARRDYFGVSSNMLNFERDHKVAV